MRRFCTFAQNTVFKIVRAARSDAFISRNCQLESITFKALTLLAFDWLLTQTMHTQGNLVLSQPLVKVTYIKSTLLLSPVVL
jgi:hypothetical protein